MKRTLRRKNEGELLLLSIIIIIIRRKQNINTTLFSSTKEIKRNFNDKFHGQILVISKRDYFFGTFSAKI